MTRMLYLHAPRVDYMEIINQKKRAFDMHRWNEIKRKEI